MARITDKERKEFHELLDFSIRKLDSPKNANKNHWSELSFNELQKMGMIEAHELELAVLQRDPKAMIDECDDIINFALFLKHKISKEFGVYSGENNNKKEGD